MKTLILGLALAVASFAGDFAGKWSGTVTLDANGETREQPALLIFKMEDGKLTGSGGPNEDKQMPFQDLKVDGDKVTFTVFDGQAEVKVEMSVEGDSLKGNANAEADGRKMSAKFDLKRAK